MGKGRTLNKPVKEQTKEKAFPNQSMTDFGMQQVFEFTGGARPKNGNRFMSQVQASHPSEKLKNEVSNGGKYSMLQSKYSDSDSDPHIQPVKEVTASHSDSEVDTEGWEAVRKKTSERSSRPRSQTPQRNVKKMNKKGIDKQIETPKKLKSAAFQFPVGFPHKNKDKLNNLASSMISFYLVLKLCVN